MAKIRRIGSAKAGEVQYQFNCPACQRTHGFKTPKWKFDGNLECPTIEPSIRVTWNRPDGTKARCCHFFVVAGKINFCNDCTHEMNAMQGVDLPDIEAVS